VSVRTKQSCFVVILNATELEIKSLGVGRKRRLEEEEERTRGRRRSSRRPRLTK